MTRRPNKQKTTFEEARRIHERAIEYKELGKLGGLSTESAIKRVSTLATTLGRKVKISLPHVSIQDDK